MKNKKYDWLFIIADRGLKKQFDEYCKEHFKVKSKKRLARSFVKSHHIKLWPCYEVGKTERLESYSFRILNVNWL